MAMVVVLVSVEVSRPPPQPGVHAAGKALDLLAQERQPPVV